MWAAPLIIATDIRNLTSDKAAIITNPEVIAIDQDSAFIGEREHHIRADEHTS